MIAERGWQAATTRAVASRAGVNPALVHYHFPSVAALRREAALAALADESAGPATALLEAHDPAEGLRACLEAMAATDPTDPRERTLWEAVAAATREPELRESLASPLGAFRCALAERLACAGHNDPLTVATLVAAALDGLILHRIADPGLDLVAAGSLLVDLVRPRAPTPTPPGEQPSGADR